MRAIDDGIWTVPDGLTYAGLRLNTRMTVCRLSDGGLALISPVSFSEARKSAIDAEGPVRMVISPNLLHHLFVGDWAAAYPDAESYGPAGLGAKRPDLSLTGELGAAFDAACDDALMRLPIAGMPRLNESLFLHRPSGTLIATDFCFHMPDARGFTRAFAWLMGIIKRTRCEPLFRVLIKDKQAFRDSLAPLRSTEIRHLSMCHHAVLSEGAGKALVGVLDQLKVRASIPDQG